MQLAQAGDVDHKFYMHNFLQLLWFRISKVSYIVKSELYSDMHNGYKLKLTKLIFYRPYYVNKQEII